MTISDFIDILSDILLTSLDETSSPPTKCTSVSSMFRRRFQSPDLKAHLEAIS